MNQNVSTTNTMVETLNRTSNTVVKTPIKTSDKWQTASAWGVAIAAAATAVAILSDKMAKILTSQGR